MAESFFRNDQQEAAPSEIPELDGAETGAGAESKFPSLDPGEFSTEEGRMAAILAYIPILCFFPLLNMRDNKEARFHARQGVILFLVELVAVLFLIDGVSRFVFRAVFVIAIALSLAGLILTLQGKSYRIPFLSDLADKVKM